MLQQVLAYSLVLATAPGAASAVQIGSLPAGDPGTERVAELLRNRLEAAPELPGVLAVGTERIHSRTVLPRFYVDRGFQPAWSDDRGPRPIADALIGALRDVRRDGLDPRDYHVAATEALVAELRRARREGVEVDPRRIVDLELLLTDGFLILGSHLYGGRLDRETIDPGWHAGRAGRDLAADLEVATRTGRVAETLNALRPQEPEYEHLRNALDRLRRVADEGGWPAVPPGPTLRLGDRDARVVALRGRLEAAGDLRTASSPVDPELFDAELDAAARAFQRRHGLGADGVVGPRTLDALNVPVEHRIGQIEVNLERWRWLPQRLGERYILVNIADFHLKVVENGRSVMDMRVVVGRPYRRTPVFTERMTYLVFSPFWHVPPGITANDVLPQVRREPGYLARNRMRVFQGWGAAAREVDPATVDWSRITAQNNPYRFRQDPGPHNALGRVKFMMPNRFNVYLHDTPSRELFGQDERAFSSGCIRVADPVGLAEYLLAGDARWTRDAIERAMSGTTERTVTLPRPIQTHLLYWTAWADEAGTVHFRRDVYERDARVDRALRLPPPAARSPV